MSQAWEKWKMHKNSDAENIVVAWLCGRPTCKWEGNKNKQTEFINKTTRALSAGRKFRIPNCDVALLRKSSISETMFSSVPLGNRSRHTASCLILSRSLQVNNPIIRCCRLWSTESCLQCLGLWRSAAVIPLTLWYMGTNLPEEPAIPGEPGWWLGYGLDSRQM